VNRTWEQVYEELVNIIKNIQTEPKRITNKWPKVTHEVQWHL
jgi:hypothetical protein